MVPASQPKFWLGDEVEYDNSSYIVLKVDKVQKLYQLAKVADKQEEKGGEVKGRKVGGRQVKGGEVDGKWVAEDNIKLKRIR
ncbi:uncharacterized protein Triagg1_1332 [Trichoderma aggressivum f. europaeum]|uniref:Uncharacterized protein n=1 Tax=Trichoderma aggressivum f. europaeum TaxID=173218 RepID=A0AAE1IJJ8_9HYPO|nr:hypothetical protein Triagg1_1332 [Trichoderma aggressivum f. europaeum]